MTVDRLLRGALRILLRCYPPDYRHQVGAELIDTHRDRVVDARRRGHLPALAAILRAVFDTAAGVPVEWAALVGTRIPRDLRVAGRGLSRRPGFSIAVILTLALGIGANTAVFSLIDAVLLRPIPVADPARLVAIYRASPQTPNDGVPFPTYKALTAGSRLLAGLAASMTHDVSLDLGGRSETTSAAVVSGNYFVVLGLQPQVGRLLVPADEGAPLANPVAVLSDALWGRVFQRRPDAVGSTVHLGATTFTVIGVAPPGFRGTNLALPQDVWVPVTMIQGLNLGGMYSGHFSATILTTFRGLGWLQLVGRLRPGVTPAQAAAEVEALLASLTPATPIGPSNRVRAVPIVDAASISDHSGLVTFSRLLVGLVVLMLALACVNVASLLTVRAAARERELGLSAALGASRGRLVCQMLLESLLLAGAGGVLGVGLGRAFMAALAAFTLPGGIAIDALGLSLDPRVLGFAVALSLVTTVLSGLMPAVRAGGADPVAAFRSQVRSGWRREPRGAMVAAQVAIVVVIVVSASLFVRSLRAGLATDLGFDPDPLVSAAVELRLSGYSGVRSAAFYSQIVEKVAALPGVTAAAVTSSVPLDTSTEIDVRPSDGSAPVVRLDEAKAIQALSIYVTPGYFATMRVPIVAGRDFSLSDHAPPDKPTLIINESAARMLWPDGRAVGRHVIDEVDRVSTVVGVVRDMKYSSLDEHGVACVYYSAPEQMVTGRMYVLARSANGAQALAAVRSAIASLDPNLPIAQSFSVRDHVDRWLAPQQFGSVLLSLFGALGLAISGVGIYATLAWRVTLRRQEIGVRLALGATGSNIVMTILRRTGAAVTLGLAVGIAAALLVAHAFDHFLFGVSWSDPAAVVATLAIVTLAVALVVILPVHDALRTDLIVAMHSDG